MTDNGTATDGSAATTDGSTAADNSSAVNDVGNSDITAIDAGNIISIDPVNLGDPPGVQTAAGLSGKSPDAGEVLALIRLCEGQERGDGDGAEKMERLAGDLAELEFQSPAIDKGQIRFVAAELQVQPSAPVETAAASGQILPVAAELRTGESSPSGFGAVCELVTDGLPVNLASLERGVQKFLDQIDRMGGYVAGIQAEHGLSGWLLAGAAAAVSCEMARRRARQRAPRFAVAADGSEADGWRFDGGELEE